MLRFTEILVSLVSRRARTRSSDFYIILHTASLLSMCPGLMSQGVGWDNVHLMPLCWHSSQNSSYSLFWEICKSCITKKDMLAFKSIQHFRAPLCTWLYILDMRCSSKQVRKGQSLLWVGKIENRYVKTAILSDSYMCCGESREGNM